MRRHLRIVYRELVMGGHLLALGTASIAAAAAMLLQAQVTVQLLLMGYLFSYGAYMMNRATEMEEDMVSNPGRTEHLRSRRRYLPYVVVLCFALGYALAVLVNWIFFAALFVPLLLSVAYSVGSKRLVRVIGARKLKEKLLIKNVAISFSWSLIPLLVGLYYLRVSDSLLLLAPFIFLRLMVNTVLFDVRDAGADARYGVRTIPTAYGQPASYRVMNALDAVCALYLVGIIAAGVLEPFAAVLLVLPIYSTLYRMVAASGEPRISLVCDLVADGEYILWGPLMYIGKIII